MSVSNNIIKAPIGLQEVYSLLGVAKQGTYYDVGYICSNAHGKINPWARYKPVRYEGFDTTGKEWWKGRDGDCGITIKRLSNYQDSVNYANGGMNGWVYSPPNGGNNPYRLTDFVGYNHNAEFPVKGFTCPDTATNQFSNSSFTCAAMNIVNPETLTDSLQMKDFRTIADCYLGVYVKQRSGSQARRVTSKSTIGGGAVTVTVNTYGMPTGTWDVYPFLCTAILEQNGLDVANTCYSLPFASKQTISIVSSYISIQVLPPFMPTVAGFVNVTLKIANNQSSSITFRNNYWQTRFTTSDFNDSFMMGESQGKIDDFTVGAKTTVQKEVQVQVSSTLIQKGSGKVFISLNTGNYIGTGFFLQSINPSV